MRGLVAVSVTAEAVDGAIDRWLEEILRQGEVALVVLKQAKFATADRMAGGLSTRGTVSPCLKTTLNGVSSGEEQIVECIKSIEDDEDQEPAIEMANGALGAFAGQFEAAYATGLRVKSAPSRAMRARRSNNVRGHKCHESLRGESLGDCDSVVSIPPS
jgi:hypothetical protein